MSQLKKGVDAISLISTFTSAKRKITKSPGIGQILLTKTGPQASTGPCNQDMMWFALFAR